MPRDGSQIYHLPPGTTAIPDTSVDSAKYNSFTADVEQDLNTPRPIVAGGTGASSAAAALVALGGEQAKQVVTNYDSNVFVAGSFYSAASATAPPVVGHAFAGICYVTDAANMFIEARDQNDATIPMYVRQLIAGVWSAWINISAMSPAIKSYIDAADALRVLKAGDTMTGELVLAGNAVNPLEAVPKQQLDAAVTAGVTGSVRYDAAQALTDVQQTQARQNIAAAPFDAMAYSGMQINGGMDVSQRNGAGAIALSGGNLYIVDGFTGSFAGAGAAFTATQILAGANVVPGGCYFKNYLTLSSTAPMPASPAAGDFVIISTAIEGNRMARLGYGVAQAAPMAVSFWIIAPLAGVVALTFRNANADRTYATEVTINNADTWEYKSVVIPGDVTGTWNRDQFRGMTISWCFGAGATYKAPSINNWNAGGYYSTAGQTNFFGSLAPRHAYITGLTVIPGIVGPPASRSALIMRPFDQEYLACQRYYETGDQPYSWRDNFSSTYAYDSLFFKMKKRVAPTVALSGWKYWSAGAYVAVAPSVGTVTDGIMTWNAGPLSGFQGWGQGGTWSADASM